MTRLDKYQKRALKAFEYALKTKEIAEQADDFLRSLFDQPPRPSGKLPFTWLVGNRKKDTEATFDAAIKFVLLWEGGYVNDPSDYGGETNQGITYKTYNNYRVSHGLKPRSVRYLTKEERDDIYKSLYWENANCDQIALVAPKLAIAHFDWAVNAGVARAVSTLQTCLNTLPDGIWGPLTQQAFDSANHENILICYLKHREGLYRTWGAKGTQKKFLKGWINRLNSLKKQLEVN